MEILNSRTDCIVNRSTVREFLLTLYKVKGYPTQITLPSGHVRCCEVLRATLNGTPMGLHDYHYLKAIRREGGSGASYPRLDLMFGRHDIQWWEYEKYAEKHGLEPYIRENS